MPSIAVLGIEDRLVTFVASVPTGGLAIHTGAGRAGRPTPIPR